MEENKLISEILNEEDCYKILKAYVQKPVQILKHKIIKADDKVIGFLGDYFRLKIYFEVISENITYDSIFFVKTEPLSNKKQRDFVQSCGVSKKEAFIYKSILPKMMEFIDYNLVPRCFLITENLLVLEDLKSRNFKSENIDYTLEKTVVLVKSLAQFHAASIILEEVNSSKLKVYNLGEKYGKELVEGTFSFVEGELQHKWMKTVVECVIDFWKTIPGYTDEKLHQKLHKVAFGGKLESLIKPSEIFRNVLTHNDLWYSNLMMNDNLEFVLIDFQLLRYTPPAYDLVMALHFNTPIEFLSENFENMLDLYYTSFSNLLVKYKLDPEEVFPRGDFIKSVEIYKLPALMEASFFATNVLLSDEFHSYIMSDEKLYEDFNYGKRSKYIIDTFKNDLAYRKKVLRLILPLADVLKKEYLDE